MGFWIIGVIRNEEANIAVLFVGNCVITRTYILPFFSS